MDTVSDLRRQLYSHPDVGVGMTLKAAINHAIEAGKITEKTELCVHALEEIRQAIYDTKDASRGGGLDEIDGLLALLSASTTTGPTSGNPVEGALQFIERLKRERVGDEV